MARHAWILAAVLGCRGAPVVEPARPVASPPVASAELPPIAPFAGSWLPTPPQQSAPWQPPAGVVGIPDALVSATGVLFAAGLADPRGLEYRTVTLTVGTVWGSAGELETQGWLLPGPGPQFAVAWNGLVYSVVAVGPAQDLAAAVADCVRADAAVQAAYVRDRPGEPFRRHVSAGAEPETVSPASLLPLKAALLLRLGEHALAREVWAAWTAGMQVEGNDGEHLRDPLLMLAVDWLWSLFDRAVCAHMRGDDRLALASARALSGLGDHIVSAVVRRGVFSERRAPSEALHFLAPLPALLADQQRRAAAEARPADDRIAELIRDLDQVNARQRSQPGGVAIGGDPRVQALVREGDEAVPALLAAIEDDTRLTRAVSFHRDFHRDRNVHTVRDTALLAVREIVDAPDFVTSFDDLQRDDRRREVVAHLRAYWLKWRGVAPMERWFRILADDGSPREQWLAAAHGLTRPDAWTFGDGVAHRLVRPRKVTAALRRRSDPSLTALLVRRIDDLAAQPGDAASRTSPFAAACGLAQDLAAWDATGGLAGLTRQWRRARDLMASERPPYEAPGCLAALTTARIRGKDRGALAEYSDWLAAQPADKVAHWAKDLVEPLWQHAGRPEAERAAERMFGEPTASWAARVGQHSFDQMLAVPMVRLRAFRALVLRILADRRPIGTVQIRDGGSLVYTVDGGVQGSSSRYPADPQMPPAGTRLTLRLCDYVAWQLAAHHELKPFELFWPEAERERALVEVAAWVRKRSDAARR